MDLPNLDGLVLVTKQPETEAEWVAYFKAQAAAWNRLSRVEQLRRLGMPLEGILMDSLIQDARAALRRAVEAEKQP